MEAMNVVEPSADEQVWLAEKSVWLKDCEIARSALFSSTTLLRRSSQSEKLPNHRSSNVPRLTGELGSIPAIRYIYKFPERHTRCVYFGPVIPVKFV